MDEENREYHYRHRKQMDRYKRALENRLAWLGEKQQSGTSTSYLKTEADAITHILNLVYSPKLNPAQIEELVEGTIRLLNKFGSVYDAEETYIALERMSDGYQISASRPYKAISVVYIGELPKDPQEASESLRTQLYSWLGTFFAAKATM